MPLHHHRVSACEEHIRHFRVIPKIADQLVCLPHSKLVLIHSHKLWPAEAKRAVGMTSLTLAREKKYRFKIFMMDHFLTHINVIRQFIFVMYFGHRLTQE